MTAGIKKLVFYGSLILGWIDRRETWDLETMQSQIGLNCNLLS